MNHLEVAICEDNPEEERQLVSILKNSRFPVKVSAFHCGEDLLEEYQAGKYDLILMDIYMEGMTGVETIRSLRQIDATVPVAFTTTSLDHTLESYRLEALKYLEKPVQVKAVQDLLELARLKKENTPQLLLRINGQAVGVPLAGILYVEQRYHHLLVFLDGGEVLRTTEKLDDLEKQFQGQSFFRCHKSFLVNLASVKNLDKELMVFTMKAGHNVHIRRESLGKARKAFEAYLIAMTRGADQA